MLLFGSIMIMLLRILSVVNALDLPPEEFPIIQSLKNSSPRFRQVRSDIEASYNADVPPPLQLYQYTVAAEETIFTIAARLMLPYSTLATLNDIPSAQTSLEKRTLLIPNQPGIFTKDPSREANTNSVQQVQLPHSEQKYYFYPGKDFSATERRTFFDQRFGFPAPSPRITSGYGMRTSPITGKPMMHSGVDFGGRSESKVLAAADGTVTAVEWSPILGFYIEIQHDENLSSIYGHLAQITINYGQQVQKSDTVGRMGSTGVSTGPHVHFEIRKNGIPVDPFLYLPKVETQ